MKTKQILSMLLFMVFVFFQKVEAQIINYNTWSTFLEKHVNSFGEVNYQAIQIDQDLLEASLKSFSKTKPESSWSKDETLAYWINAYNAFTIKLIIDNYPIKSIKDLKNPWDQKFIPIGKQSMSLNEIEHEILRKMNEPRIHFAIVCASKSCPKLLNKAYLPSKLDLQLTVATEDFLSDESKNNISKDQITISKIFKWFSEDFTQNGSLIEFLNKYTSVQISKKAKKKFMNYNWELNE
ncbi:DUF547 domain-containing protein [Xanthomarina sp. F2636L]|uniref:DUF547 domain-containing protein n=1 Tax=Xanthomarina sp. F2636L TaxID=2996018 RepID=UPI00225DDACF|nr:DUF547 domain-containing protein [Xanthomarina sp. F2636L]MCX7550904.1 DUF547 domain-containing protein [Xanthomarina sp. F2636L]